MNRWLIVAVAAVAIVLATLATGSNSGTGTPVASAGAGTAAPGSGGGATTSATAVDLVALRRAAGIPDCPPSSDRPAVPGGLPEVTLNCLGGDSSVRLAGLRGPMLINLWAQWCEPCRAEAADIAGFASGQSEVAVLGINYSDPQQQLAVEFAQLMSMTFPQLEDVEATVRGPLGVAGIPHTVLIDAKGVVVARHPGAFTSAEELRVWVAEGLGK